MLIILTDKTKAKRFLNIPRICRGGTGEEKSFYDEGHEYARRLFNVSENSVVLLDRGTPG